MFKRTSWVAALVVSLCCAAAAHGQVNVGDKPTLRFEAFNNGGKVDLAALRGKIVVVDFWATWCGPCMAEANHMVQIHQTYGPKGLAMIGISLDYSAADLVRVINEKKFTWPQYYDGNQAGVIKRAWGVGGIPDTFIIGPDGTVLWRGHPARIDQPLADAFKNHPPQLVEPRVLAAAKAALDEIDAAVKGDKPLDAIRLLAKVPAEAMADEETKKRADTLKDGLVKFAEGELAGVEPLVEQKQYRQAIAKLRDLQVALRGLPVADKAKDRLVKLMGDPAAKTALAEADRADRATEALAVATKLRDGAKHEDAYKRYKAVTTDYAGTDAAVTAQAVVAEYETDPGFVKKVTEVDVAGKAKSALTMADNYRRAGKVEQAKQRYQKVIDEFPGTPQADEAKKQLKDLK